MSTYYPDYAPANAEQFDRMVKVFRATTDKDHLNSWVFMYTMDPSYDRQDIVVAMGRIEREKGWK